MIQKIGKYIVVDKIAKGGMGTVYKAKHPTLDRYVILKQLNLKGVLGVAERFKREAKIMFDFRNENIVQVYDHFKEGSSYYIVMEYVDGMGIDKLIQVKRYLSNEIAILIITEICKGLKYAHDKGVIHRDIKPANILISKEGEVKLTDFGIAKSDDDSQLGLTQKGTTLGTPSYMAPEQITDSKNVDKRADIFSLGVLFYQMVTGKLPFASDLAVKTIALIEKGKYKKPRKINPRIFPSIQSVIKKMMQNKKKKRYSDLEIIISKFKPYIKKYKTQQKINEAIKDYIFGNESSNSIKNLQKNGLFNIKTFIFKIVFSTLFVAGLAYLLYFQGLFYDLFLRDKYGSVNFIVKVEKKYKGIDKNYYNVFIAYKDKKNKYININNIKCILNKNKNKDNYEYYESGKTYLPSHEYKIDIIIENEHYYKELFIEPIAAIQGFNLQSKAKDVEIVQTQPPRLPLEVKFDFIDLDNENYIDDVSIYVYNNSEWIKWEDYIDKFKEILKTGRPYYFKFEKDGYFEKKINISASYYDSLLKLNVYLIQKPGYLNIRSNYVGLDILLNDSKYYYSGGEYKQYIKIDPTTLNEQKLILASGNYSVSIKKDDITKIESIYISPSENKNIFIDYNAKNSQIQIKKN